MEFSFAYLMCPIIITKESSSTTYSNVTTQSLSEAQVQLHNLHALAVEREATLCSVSLQWSFAQHIHHQLFGYYTPGLVVLIPSTLHGWKYS